jgi:hypothetical protein
MRKQHFVFLGILVLSVQIIQAQSILKDFSGKQTSQRTIYLEWTTKAGSTCADLSIERSFEGGAFEEVFQYNGICGESDKDQDYSHTDSIAQGGMYGYRINENNGNHSDTLFVQAFTDGAAVVAYPNPARDIIYLRFSDNNVVAGDLKLIDRQGNVLMSAQNAEFKDGLRTAELPSGIYTLLIYLSNTSVVSVRFVRIN